jgi:hypothetical protein
MYCRNKFWSSMSFQNLVRLPAWLSPRQQCQKIEKKMTINVIQHDDRLWYLRLFYNGAFLIVSKNDLDDQNLLLATVPIILFVTIEIYEKVKIRRLKCIRVMRKQNVIKMLRFFTISFNQANDVYVKIYKIAQLTVFYVF